MCRKILRNNLKKKVKKVLKNKNGRTALLIGLIALIAARGKEKNNVSQYS